MFVAIPDDLVGKMDSDVLILLSKLYSFHRMGYAINAKNKWLAEYLGKSARQVRRMLVWLENEKYITCAQAPGGHRTIKMTTTTGELFADLNLAQKKQATSKYKKRLPEDIKEDEWFKKYKEKLEAEED